MSIICIGTFFVLWCLMLKLSKCYRIKDFPEEGAQELVFTIGLEKSVILWDLIHQVFLSCLCLSQCHFITITLDYQLFFIVALQILIIELLKAILDVAHKVLQRLI